VRAALATGVLVPAVVTLPITSARARLKSAGLLVDESGEVIDGVPESSVLRQSPESNARVALGSLVRLVIAVRRTVTVPDLTGRDRNGVEQLLTPIALVASFEELTTSDANAVAGAVIRQDPLAGAVVGSGTAVRVFLARVQAVPPPPPPPPVLPTPAPAPVPTTDPVWFARIVPIMPWLGGIGLFSVVAYRFIKANRASVQPPARALMDQEPPDSPPVMPNVNLDPHVDQVTSRLEVTGPGLIQFEVRIRTGHELNQQSLSVHGPLTGEERRVYE
jgi:hypothetical protein